LQGSDFGTTPEGGEGRVETDGGTKWVLEGRKKKKKMNAECLIHERREGDSISL